MTKVVYLDVVLLGNLVMNYLILWSTAKFAKNNPGRWRLLLGAAVGSIYALTVFIPELYVFLQWICKLVLSIVMVLATFGILRWRQLMVTLLYFYISSFAIGGLVFGSMYFMQSASYNAQTFDLQRLINNYFWQGIAVAIIVALIIGHWGSLIYRKRSLQQQFKRDIVIKMLDQQVQFEGLVDTGNYLTDPITGLPVMVVEYRAMEKVLPASIKEFYKAGKFNDFAKVEQAISHSPCASKVSFIPFKSIGKENGLLLGLRPDIVEINGGNQSISTNRVIVAIHQGELASSNGYQALLHPELIKVA